jgi:hypothetical protein
MSKQGTRGNRGNPSSTNITGNVPDLRKSSADVQVIVKGNQNTRLL